MLRAAQEAATMEKQKHEMPGTSTLLILYPPPPPTPTKTTPRRARFSCNCSSRVSPNPPVVLSLVLALLFPSLVFCFSPLNPATALTRTLALRAITHQNFSRRLHTKVSFETCIC